MIDPGIRTYEDCDGTDVLNNDSRICDKWPKVVRAKARVTLKMIKEGFWICIIVRICMRDGRKRSDQLR